MHTSYFFCLGLYAKHRQQIGCRHASDVTITHASADREGKSRPDLVLTTLVLVPGIVSTLSASLSENCKTDLAHV